MTPPATPADSPAIPGTWEQWRHCIEVECRLALTPDFIAQRLAELDDTGHFRTHQFTALYGDEHRRRVVGWFRRAAAETGASA